MQRLISLSLPLTFLFLGSGIAQSNREDSSKTTTESDPGPKMVTRNAFQVIGIGVRTTNQDENNPTTAKIPGLWNHFYRDEILLKIPNKKSNSPVLGLYTNYATDYTGPFDLVACAEVENLSRVPEGMVGASIPTEKYLVFPANGKMPDAVIKAWNDIWNYFATNSEYQRAYTSDFELYKSPSEADIYIAVK